MRCKMKKRFIYAFAISVLSSCSFLDLEPTIISKETFYKNEAEALYGLAGVYGAMSHEAFYGNYYSLMISNTDDLSYFNRPVQASTALQQYHFDAGNEYIRKAWTRIYRGIGNANAFMEAVSSTDFDPSGALYAEARFLRAYYHFILAEAWGDVPVRDKEVTDHSGIMAAAKPQTEVLSWCANEMEACLGKLSEDTAVLPSRINRAVAEGVLARVYLFMAGESVKGTDKSDCFTKARDHAAAVIGKKTYKLNPDYSQVFINMIMDDYDKDNLESMWEVEFLGDRSNASLWSNGRIGDLLGLQSTGSTDYTSFKCNYSYGMYDGSLKLWDLYWIEDRTEDERAQGIISDRRQQWNLPPYNYAGNNNYPPYGVSGSGSSRASIDKTPYAYNNVSTTMDPTAAQAIRNCGKFRREVQYEGVKSSKLLYTTINYPLLRYSDVLLMYAEAANEIEGGPSDLAYDCVKQVRDRAGIKTIDKAEYNQESFRSLVRNERGRELCFESLRKYDLIRWGIFVKSMQEYGQWTADARWSKNDKAKYAGALSSAVQQRHICLPIPLEELGVNTLLQQNPLW